MDGGLGDLGEGDLQYMKRATVHKAEAGQGPGPEAAAE